MVCPRPERYDTPRALMSVTANLCCDETKTEEHTLAWHLWWLGFNLAETTSAPKRPSAAGAQLSEAPAVEAEREEDPAQGKWQEGHRAVNRDSKKLTWLSLRFQKTSG